MNNSKSDKIIVRGFLHSKKIQLLLAFMVLSFIGKSQENVIHIGETLKIPPGVNLYIMGALTDSSSSQQIINNGTVHVQGNLINHGTQKIFGSAPTKGTLRFFGRPADNARILGTDTININHFKIDLLDTALAGNVSLKVPVLNSYGNVSFIKGGFDLDKNTLNLRYYLDSTYFPLGIIQESNTGRPLLLTDTLGKISVLNYPFASNTTFPNIHGIGLGFYQMDALGGTPILSRTFRPMACGDSAGHIGSIQRLFRMQGNTNAALFKNTKIKYLSPSELAGNQGGSTLRVFESQSNGNVWSQNLHSAGPTDSTTISSDTNTFNPNPINSGNFYTVITAATSPCANLASIHINQIVTPTITYFDIDSVISCNANVNAHLYATGEYGAAFSWKAPGSNVYQYQNSPAPPNFFVAQGLGTYWVRMTTIRGCIDSASIRVVMVPAGNAAITPHTDICLGTPVTMNPVNPLNASNNYMWDFGDGDTVYTYSVTHNFATNGNHIVTLTVTTAQGCVSSSNDTIMVNANPVASFTVSASSLCPGSTINFDNTSQVTSLPTTVSLDWNFGDASPIANTSDNISGTSSPATTHSYALTGTYYATLVANANGCSSPLFTDTITIYPVPVAQFSSGGACAGQLVNFTNNSIISDSSPLTYYWDFTGAGPTITTQNPTYSYASGTYNVTLITTSDHFCKDTITHPITIGQNPTVAFTVSNACVNTGMVYTDNTVTGSTPYTYSWNFGDNTSASVAAGSHVYSSPGTYPVSLVLTTSTGCVDSATQNVTIYPGPTVSFYAVNLYHCQNSSVSFVSVPSSAVSYSWNFPGIAATSVLASPVETYTLPGTFPVYLTETSANGCVASDTGSVTISPLPVLSLGTTLSTCGSTYTMDANIGGVNTGSNFLWSTGATTPQYTATFNGTYTVTVNSPQGCTSRDTAIVTLNSIVSPTLGANRTVCGGTVLDAGYPGATIHWSTNATTDTIHVTTTGTYTVSVTDQNNCVGTASVIITVNAPPTPPLGPDIVVCASTPVTLNAGAAAGYLWNDGSTSQTLQVPAIAGTGYYWVTVTSGLGCTVSDTIQVTIHPTPIFTLGPDIIACDHTVLNANTSNSSYSWSTFATTPTITVSVSGLYFVTVTENTFSCIAQDSINVTINPLPTVNLGSDINLCSYSTGIIDAGNTGSTYLWNSGQTTQTITVSTQGNYSVIVTDGNNCSNTDNINVNVLPVFTIELGVDRPFCPGSTLILDAQLTTTGNSYLWEYYTATVATTATYSVVDTGRYYLTVTNSYGCIGKDSVNILPSNYELHAQFLAVSEIDQGESVVFVNLSYPRPYTSEWFLGSISVSNDSTPTIGFTMPVTPNTDTTIYVTMKVSNQYCLSEKTKSILVHGGHRPIISNNQPIASQDPNDYSVINSVNLYPNPNNGTFNFFIDISKESYSEITIFSITGSMVYSEKTYLTTGITSYNLNDLSPGIYFFQVNLYSERRTLKFIKTPN